MLDIIATDGSEVTLQREVHLSLYETPNKLAYVWAAGRGQSPSNATQPYCYLIVALPEKDTKLYLYCTCDIM